jgi:hypothetical protein
MNSAEGKQMWDGFAHIKKIADRGGLRGVPKLKRCGSNNEGYKGTFDVTPLDLKNAKLHKKHQNGRSCDR